jgi:hypothetical protein
MKCKSFEHGVLLGIASQIIDDSDSIVMAYSPFDGKHFKNCYVVFVDEVTKNKVLEKKSSWQLHGKTLAIGRSWLENYRYGNDKPHLLCGWCSDVRRSDLHCFLTTQMNNGKKRNLAQSSGLST